jgi:four helix bundle protein
MDYVRSYRELEVYKLARQLARDIFELTKTFPKEEMYSLTDQIRRSSRSVGAQIAEAWGKRKYEKHFVSKLSDLDGEQLETQHWLETALDCLYIANERADYFLSQYALLGRMLSSMMNKSDKFCKPT